MNAPILALSSDAQLFEFSLDGGEGLCSGCVEDELGLCEFVEVLQGFGLSQRRLVVRAKYSRVMGSEVGIWTVEVGKDGNVRSLGRSS